VETMSEPAGPELAAPPNGDNGCRPQQTLSVTAQATPDLEPGRPGVQVVAGTRVQLTGTCNEVILTADCEVNETPLPFTWTLSFQPPGGSESDVSSSLANRTTLTPHFIATNEGTYRARLRGGNATLGTQTRAVQIDAAPPPPVLLERTGLITFLRVHDLGSGFGPPSDFVDVEAVIKLDSEPSDAYGLQLRNDRHRPSHQGMLDLLRDAFFDNRRVTIDFSIVPGRHNGLILRVALSR
jgi:hypothetical protein